MSYARKGLDGSDVYVVATSEDWRCIECSLTPGPSPGESAIAPGHVCSSAAEMVEHLYLHRSRGDQVPQSAIDRLRKEAAVP